MWSSLSVLIKNNLEFLCIDWYALKKSNVSSSKYQDPIEPIKTIILESRSKFNLTLNSFFCSVKFSHREKYFLNQNQNINQKLNA